MLDSRLAQKYKQIKQIYNADEFSVNELYDEFGSPLTFTIYDDDGSIIELEKNGSQKYVSKENGKEYIKLLRRYILAKFIPQLDSIKKGFLQIVPKSIVPLLTASELQERIAGKRDIDIEYLKQHTMYDGISEDSPIVKYFWDALRSFSNEHRSMFLRFVWGRSTLPASPEEFTEKFCITKMITDSVGSDLTDDQMLPHAHTCAFQIELPQYSSEKVMKEKLMYAITNCRDIDLEWQKDNSDDF